MKAFQFEDISNGLELKDVPVPKPSEGQVLVQVKAAGLCHTDCHVLNGKEKVLIIKRPITLGHEVAGTIVELGSGVTGFNVGDNVVSGMATNRPITISDMKTSVGIGFDGGYAEFALFYASKTLKIPDGVSFAQAAAATDAVATAYHAVIGEGQTNASTTIGIIGLGGLGLSGVQIAALMGAKVYGVDLDARKFVTAQQHGATMCAKSLERLAGIHFDVIVDFAGAGTTTAAAAKAVKPGGRVVLVGLAATETTLSTHEFIAQSVTLLAGSGSTLDELQEVLQLISKGSITPILEEIPFYDIPAGLKRLEEGAVLGRLFVNPSQG